MRWWVRTGLGRALAEGAAHRPGLAAVRTAVAAARELVESPKETELRLLLRDAGFVEPEINRTVKVRDADGDPHTFRLDLSCRGPQVAIEDDGDGHRTDRRQWLKDRHKDNLLRSVGWEVVRVTQDDLDNPSDLVARLDQLGVPRRGQLPLSA